MFCLYLHFRNNEEQTFTKFIQYYTITVYNKIISTQKPIRRKYNTYIYNIHIFSFYYIVTETKIQLFLNEIQTLYKAQSVSKNKQF